MPRSETCPRFYALVCEDDAKFGEKVLESICQLGGVGVHASTLDDSVTAIEMQGLPSEHGGDHPVFDVVLLDGNLHDNPVSRNGSDAQKICNALLRAARLNPERKSHEKVGISATSMLDYGIAVRYDPGKNITGIEMALKAILGASPDQLQRSTT
ncbi:hypothetical protein KBD11_02370 [Candidatus Saccharibacteria bacterium]|nr:hypothetical protein [Candidatus Saccharibacteria bacterium]